MVARCLIWFRALICFSFRQNSIHGSTIIAQFYSATKQCIVHGDCEISNIYIYNKTSTDDIITQIYDDFYLKLEIDDLFTNINISNYYDKSYIDYSDNEISTKFLNTYTNTETDAVITTYTGSENIDITSNELSLTFPLKINDEIVLNPRSGGAFFEMHAGTSGFAFFTKRYWWISTDSDYEFSR